jgi:hypothetical protein
MRGRRVSDEKNDILRWWTCAFKVDLLYRQARAGGALSRQDKKLPGRSEAPSVKPNALQVCMTLETFRDI